MTTYHEAHSSYLRDSPVHVNSSDHLKRHTPPLFRCCVLCTCWARVHRACWARARSVVLPAAWWRSSAAPWKIPLRSAAIRLAGLLALFASLGRHLKQRVIPSGRSLTVTELNIISSGCVSTCEASDCGRHTDALGLSDHLVRCPPAQPRCSCSMAHMHAAAALVSMDNAQ